MRFSFSGFKQDGGFRVFSYDARGEDGVRLRFTVRVNLEQSRQYGIRLQELPLLCVTVLERRTGNERDLIFTEEAMARHVEDAAAAQEAEAAKNTPKRRAKNAAAEEDDPYESAPMPNPYGRSW